MTPLICVGLQISLLGMSVRVVGSDELGNCGLGARTFGAAAQPHADVSDRRDDGRFPLNADTGFHAASDRADVERDRRSNSTGVRNPTGGVTATGTWTGPVSV
jgi:hypothetical protein